jgi:2-C-methyl-D-erythritol 4-phosphate cytidylyltransferase/2-C-methyl-D-erythritol 2,4-cyclodiphosphate synthase
MRVTAIIAAAGRGERLGGGVPKQLLDVGGRPMLERSVTTFLRHPAIAELIVALPADLLDTPPEYLLRQTKPVRLVGGGARRQDSVVNAFRAVDEQSEIIVIHDAARPFASADLISRTIGAAMETGAALAAVPASDTVKKVAQEAGGRTQDVFVVETLPRDVIFLAQTPQAFRREVLRDALARGVDDATDEASLVERAGYSVRIVEGERTNIKVTTPDDLMMADLITKRGTPSTTARAGTGYDLHRLVAGRPLILGGVAIPFDRGLAGHSDGDAVCHAITDAILGAAAGGDIGRHFPDTDDRWRGASSLMLLGRASEVVRQRGFRVVNVDATVILERPKLAPHIEAICANIADALGIPADCVSVKGKTNEGVGEIGRGEALAVHAIALLQ